MEDLLEACNNFDLSQVESCLADKNEIKDIFGHISSQCFKGNQSPEDQLQLIELLVKHGADVNVLDDDGHAVIHYACKHPNPKVSLLPKLISIGADINIQTGKSLLTPLHLCSRHNDRYDEPGVCYYNNVKLLLKSGANVQLLDSNGKTPLHYLVVSRHSTETEKLAQLMIQKGADINVRDDLNQTVLHVSHFTQVIRGQIVTAAWDEYLILHGADVNVRDNARDKELPMERRFNNQMFFRGMNLFAAMGNNESTVFPWSLKRILMLSLKAGLDMKRFCKDLLESVINELLKTDNYHLILALTEAGGRVYIYQGTYSSWKQLTSTFITLLNRHVVSLKQHAANAIRTSLKPNALVGVEKLGLPKSMNDFIVMKEYQL